MLLSMFSKSWLCLLVVFVSLLDCDVLGVETGLDHPDVGVDPMLNGYMLMDSKHDSLRKEMRKMIKSKVEKLEAKFNETIRQEVATLLDAVDAIPRAKCPVVFQQHCFFAIVPKTRISFADGEEKCKMLKATPANVYRRPHQRFLENYIAPLTVSVDGLTLWVGMNIRPPSTDVTFYNGSLAVGTVRWGGGNWPMAGEGNPGRTQLALKVGERPNIRSGGMQNLLPEWEIDGILCEIA